MKIATVHITFYHKFCYNVSIVFTKTNIARKLDVPVSFQLLQNFYIAFIIVVQLILLMYHLSSQRYRSKTLGLSIFLNFYIICTIIANFVSLLAIAPL